MFVRVWEKYRNLNFWLADLLTLAAVAVYGETLTNLCVDVSGEQQGPDNDENWAEEKQNDRKADGFPWNRTQTRRLLKLQQLTLFCYIHAFVTCKL